MIRKKKRVYHGYWSMIFSGKGENDARVYLNQVGMMSNHET